MSTLMKNWKEILIAVIVIVLVVFFMMFGRSIIGGISGVNKSANSQQAAADESWADAFDNKEVKGTQIIDCIKNSKEVYLPYKVEVQVDSDGTASAMSGTPNEYGWTSSSTYTDIGANEFDMLNSAYINPGRSYKSSIIRNTTTRAITTIQFNGQ